MTKSSKILTDIRRDGVIVTDTLSARVNEGVVFQADRVVEGVADNGATDMLLRPPSDMIPPHSIFTVAASGEVRIDLYEDVTFSAAGSAVAAANRNRTSANTAALVVNADPTVTDLGTLVATSLIPSGGFPFFTIGGLTQTLAEWILNPGSVYLFRTTNLSGAAADVFMGFDWYEPPDSVGVLR